MRLTSIELSNVPPIKRFLVENIADVLVLAGPNGVGKTRLVQHITSAFRNPAANSNTRLVVDATCESEIAEWGSPRVDTADSHQAAALARTIQKNRRRAEWTSSIFQFESDRTNPTFSGYSFSFDGTDPWDEFLGWDFAFSGLRNRFQDTINSLFRKVHSRRLAIADAGEQLIRKGGGHLDPSMFPDPLTPFKKAFSQLLAPKELLDLDLKDQNLYYQFDGQRFALGQLSSGEREVVNIVFDFLLRNPSDSIVIFDEPELHLHPELSYKLLNTLRSSGNRNQFVFVTHSPDIITASLEHSVIFISPPKGVEHNQAVPVSENDSTHEALKQIGQSIGIVSLGKKVVLIEGAKTSLDKQTYGAIIEDKFPGLVLVPSGGKDLIRSFSTLTTHVLAQSLWGVEFFMLCDRDALPVTVGIEDYTTKSNGRLRVLERYHLENYFLDENILSRVFMDWEPLHSWLRDPIQINAKLRDIAKVHLPYAVALAIANEFRERVGNLDIMVKGCNGKTSEELKAMISTRMNSELQRFSNSVNQGEVETATEAAYSRLSLSLDNGTWKFHIPGKAVFDQFASAAGVSSSRLKLRYLAEARRAETSPFDQILQIFADFSQM